MLPLLANAERLSLKVYTNAEGLTDNTARPLLASKRGYLWAASGPDLARFDGHTFRIYSSADGWNGGRPFWMTETSDGQIYIGAGFGLYRLEANAITAAERFQRIELPGSSRDIEYVFEDSQRRLWVSGRDGGYLRSASGTWRPLSEVKPATSSQAAKVNQAAEDSRGDIWLASFSGIRCFRKSGEVEHYTRADYPQLSNFAIAAVRGPDDRMYFGFEGGGVARLARPNPQSRAVVERIWTTQDGLPSMLAGALAFWKGSLWVGTYGGLARIDASGQVQPYLELGGTKNPPVEQLLVDGAGSMWWGTDGAGLMVAVDRGFTSFGVPEGLDEPRIEQVLESRDGEIIAVGKNEKSLSLHRFNGLDRFEPYDVALPGGVGFPWAWGQIAFETASRQWWLASGGGPISTPAPGVLQHGAEGVMIHREAFGGARGSVFRLFEDSRGGIWVSLSGIRHNHVTYLEPGAKQWRSFPNVASDDVPPNGYDNSIAGFAEDKAGNIWMGCLTRGLWRYRRGGTLEKIEGHDGINAKPRFLHVDDAGRLWIGTQFAGLLRVDDPAAAKPVFRSYQTSDGLSSNSTMCVTSARDGDIYVCTGRGIDRLNPETGRIRTYTIADGLIGGSLRTAFRDRKGVLWFGTTEGVSRFVPRRASRDEPGIVIQELSVGSETVPLPVTGLTQTNEIRVEPHQQRLQVQFVSFDSKAKYQHRLEGINEWSAPSINRSVLFEGLSPGAYRFQVRAVNEDGVAGSQTAVLALHVVPPVWQRWWFLALCAGTMLAAGYGLHRYRMQQVLALERVRARIAADLHDDIGSSLSQVSMLGELAKRSLNDSNGGAQDLIERMAATSREAVASMSDIVWAIHPRNDNLAELVQRMRRFASDLLSARDIEFQFHAPVESQDAVPIEVRRDVLLIFKESVHNAAKHSGCSRVEAELAIQNGQLILRVQDNGRGFVSEHRGAGHGLSTMVSRAERLNGRAEIRSEPGKGTTVSAHFPI